MQNCCKQKILVGHLLISFFENKTLMQVFIYIYINEWENALKTHKTKNNNFKKQIKKNTQNKTVITIIFDGKL